MSWKTFMVRTLVLLAIPVGLAMTETAWGGCRASSCGAGKAPARQEGMGQFLTTKLGLTAEQTEKFKTMLDKHLAAMKAERERFEAEVGTILTPEQKATFEGMKEKREQRMKGSEGGMKRGGRIGQALEQMNLPADKLAQVKAIVKESREKMMATPRGDRAAWQQNRKDMMEKIKAVLTPEEMTKFEEVMKENHPGRGMGPGGKPQ